MKTSTNDHQHWFLIVGQIIFRTEKEGELMNAFINTVSGTRDGKLPLKAIGKAQQLLQMEFHRSTGEAYEIANVVILNMVPLGLMTTAEFNEGHDRKTIMPTTGNA